MRLMTSETDLAADSHQFPADDNRGTVEHDQKQVWQLTVTSSLLTVTEERMSTSTNCQVTYESSVMKLIGHKAPVECNRGTDENEH
ncbi:hypothetical protein J6590_093994 [Homalodisca vitripennis]|nr:hypothetical protein J6590_093994 [Homalodisca vitripennis]